MHLYTAFSSVYRISRKSDNEFTLYGHLDKKKEKKQRNSYLENAWHKIWNVGYRQWGHFHSKKLSSFIEAAQSYVRIKITSCQYTYSVVCQLLGPHDTLPHVLMVCGASNFNNPTNSSFTV